MKLILFVLIILVNQISQSTSCKCVVRPPKDQFCGSEFTVRVLVNGIQDFKDQNKRVYQVTVEQIYRANEEARTSLGGGKLHTNRHSSSCGVILADDRSYILTGTVSNGKTSIHNCGFHKLTSDVSDDVKRGFEGEYKSQCN